MLDNSEDRSCASDLLSFLTHTATICCAATGSACYQWKLFPLHCFHFCKRLGGRDGYFPFILTAGSRWTQIGNVIKSYASKWHSICLCMLNSAPGFSSRSALFSLLSCSVNIFSLLWVICHQGLGELLLIFMLIFGWFFLFVCFFCFLLF